MRSEDPLASFLIQHIGTPTSPRAGWGLNFRTEDALRALLTSAGFTDMEVFDDANYPRREEAEKHLPERVDALPAEVEGKSLLSPVTLPNESILSGNRGYNWIAIAHRH